MGKIEDLRQKEAELIERMDALANAETWGEDDAAKFADLESDLAGVRRRIEAAETVRAAKAATAKPVRRLEPDADMVPAEPRRERIKGGAFANIIQALAVEQGNRRGAAAYALEQDWADKERIAKALGSSSAAGGGFLVPEEFSNDIVELLRNEAVVFRAGPRIVPMNGTMTMPKLTSGASGSYIGENSNISKEQQTFGQLRLTAKKLASLVPISNDLLRNSSPQADQVVRDDMVAGLQVTADAALIRDQGDGAAPKGLRYWAASGNVTATNGTTATQVEQDIRELILGLKNNNSPMIRPVWLMAPRSVEFLADLRDANGNKIYPTIDTAGTLRRMPIFETNNIPTNLGGGTESEIYLVDMAQVVIGEETGIEVMVSDTAAYHDGSNVVAAFSQDQTVIRAIMRHDMVVRHDTSIAVKTGITYGA